MSHETELAAPNVAAWNSQPFRVTNDDDVVTMIVSGDMAGDSVTVQFSVDKGLTWADVYESGSVKVISQATNNPETVYGTGLFRMVKGASTNALGAYISK
jgi:hypothetical protein